MEPSLKETDDGQEKEIIKPAVAAKQSIPSIICSACDIQGNVTFGKGCIERVVIYNKAPKEKPPGWTPKTVKIGSFNLFEVGTIIETSDIGNYNMFQHRAHVESNCTIKNGCNIGTSVRIPSKTVLEDRMCMHFPNKIVENSNFNEENHKIGLLGLIEMLSKLLPKHNTLKQV